MRGIHVKELREEIEELKKSNRKEEKRLRVITGRIEHLEKMTGIIE